MIRLGLTSFSEHDYLTGKKRSTLYEYASHLPLVEMDTAYYGIPPKERVAEWVKAVPENFRFVIKFIVESVVKVSGRPIMQVKKK